MKKFYVLLTLAFFSACNATSDSKYTRLVNEELSKGKRYDNLFMNMHFGMTSKQFFSYCWELNKKGVFTDGNNNTAVMYKIKDQLKSPASMNFYPDFYENKIYRMRTDFEYDAWAPWNKALYADSLLPDLKKMFMRWYPNSNEFINLTDPNRGTIYVKVDGNRRITMGRYNDRQVKVEFTDLLVEKKIKQN